MGTAGNMKTSLTESVDSMLAMVQAGNTFTDTELRILRNALGIAYQHGYNAGIVDTSDRFFKVLDKHIERS